MAGLDHKTRDVISFCKGRLRPKRRVDLPGALSAPSPQGQGSRGAARRRVIPTPHSVTHTPTRVHSTLSRVHVRSSALEAPITHHPCTHARTGGSATPTQHHCSPHPAGSHILSATESAAGPRESSPPRKVHRGWQAAGVAPTGAGSLAAC